MDHSLCHFGGTFLFSPGILKIVSTIALALFLISGIFLTQQAVWEPIERSFYALGKNPGFVPSAAQIRPVLFGFDHFSADLFWLRAVQYAGSNAGDFSFDALPSYIALVTDLDPHFLFPYRFAALIFPMNDAARDGVPALLKKGIQENPQSPDLLLDLAFFEYYYRGDTDAAVLHYEECFRQFPERCPPFARNVAANLRAKKGKYEIALKIWLEKLALPDLSGEEQSIILQKIEESAKLIALNCALTKKPSTTRVVDLIGVDTRDCPIFREFSPETITPLAGSFDLFRISQKTTETPFRGNPFALVEGRVGTARW